MLCVHLGPGRLGLGLVVDTLLALEPSVDICVLGAHGGPAELPNYEITFVGEHDRPQSHRVRWAGNPATIDDLDPEVLERLRSGEAVLFTGSLAYEAAARANLLRAMLQERGADAETVVLACENEADEMYEEVTGPYGGQPRLHYCPCVADRVVNWNEPLRHPDGRRRLLAHPVAQWVIWHPFPDRSEVVAALGSAAPVVLAADKHQLEGYRKRKRWVVNGGHLLMALIDRFGGSDELPRSTDAQDDLRANITPLIDTALDAIECEHPDLPYDSAFAAERRRVFWETPGSTNRILAERLVRCDLRPLMRHFEICVAGAARATHHLGRDCEPFESVVGLLLDTLENRLAYFDVWRPADLSPHVDNDVVSALHRITEGWMDPDRGHRAADRLSTLLALHRMAPR